MNESSSAKRRLCNRLAVSATVALLSAPVFGQQTVAPGARALETEAEPIRVYSVELIVFEYVAGAMSGGEIFLPDAPPPLEDSFFTDPVPGEQMDPGVPMGDELVSANEPPLENIDAGDDSDVLLPAIPAEDVTLDRILTYGQAGLDVYGPEDYVLDEIYARLERLDAYRPLMRAAWSQKTIGKDETLPIPLRRLGDPPLRLDGTVTLYLSRFLHLELKLALEDRPPQRLPPDNNRLRRYGDNRTAFRFDSAFFVPSTFYRIDEDRIVKNGELRYYDHPKFGVIAKISRVEEADPPSGEQTPFGDPLSGGN